MLVYYVYLYFLIKLNPTSCQFKEHIDLQNIAEIIFKNEKYNVLKPTVHIIKDHFVEFIQKRHNIDTSERMFLDRNGLRHIWKGLEIPRLRSLRKADPQRAIDDKNTNNNITATISTKKDNKRDNRQKKGNKRQGKTTITATPESIKPSLRDNEVVVKTTFFCPFFGVVRMSTRVQKFDEAENITRRFNIND